MPCRSSRASICFRPRESCERSRRPSGASGGAADGSFKMPNPDLPKLDATPAGFKKLATDKAKIFQFMMKQVEPQTAQLLGEQPYDMKTNTGFGCMNCHTKK